MALLRWRKRATNTEQDASGLEWWFVPLRIRLRRTDSSSFAARGRSRRRRSPRALHFEPKPSVAGAEAIERYLPYR